MSVDEIVFPDEPAREPLDMSTKRGKLVGHVRDALAALPVHFTSQTSIEGLEAGDLFSLNSMLGGSIEIQVVQTLNRLRAVWDPDEEWDEYQFVRSSQTFPDVRLVTDNATLIGQGNGIGLGIELKGWYLLSREKEPSFRYKVTRNSCDEHDLLVVVPWHLKNVLSGEPVVYAPFVDSARFAVDLRNHYWVVGRRQGDLKKGTIRDESYYSITSPADVSSYPAPKDKINDVPKVDGGNNFGRVARANIMQDYVDDVLASHVSGIQAKYWVEFFGTYSDGAQKDELHAKIMRMVTKHRLEQGLDSDDLRTLLERWESRLPPSER